MKLYLILVRQAEELRFEEGEIHLLSENKAYDKSYRLRVESVTIDIVSYVLLRITKYFKLIYLVDYNIFTRLRRGVIDKSRIVDGRMLNFLYTLYIFHDVGLAIINIPYFGSKYKGPFTNDVIALRRRGSPNYDGG